MPLQAFDLPHLSGFRTHTHNLVRWLDVTRFRKMRTLLGGLRVPHPTEPGKHGLAVHNPSSSGVGGQTLFAAGLPVLLALVETSLHVVGAGGQTLFAAGLPTFRFVAGLIQFPGRDLACSHSFVWLW